MNPANNATPRFLEDAGIAPGMRVLDLGCGSGDLTRLVAHLVGPTGAVVGIDRDERALANARTKHKEGDSGAVSYALGDLSDGFPAQGTFDAIVGRRILMYLPDPFATLVGLLQNLNSGGLVAFQEHAATGMPVSDAPIPLHRQVHRWTWDTVAREGGNVNMGLTLPTLFRRAGLVLGEIHAEAILLVPGAASSVAEIIRAMMPRIVMNAIASEAEIDVETLDERLATERREADEALLWDVAYCASARRLD